ncbi:KTSC domain-containing protein [Serratia marcescens]|uniref:KTSC domain-containing protein n=1 Tax=Serratia TaxID=613 RepID=UPI000CDD2E7C|nr:KTSC domain-containing protein [Serratia marcescens]POW86009.1 KTSC domain-containing protein [Serratia marcescens]POW90511.1 KTSC domain-containing protein [Serratia marcescens]POX04658.1 KTSC domain-containing protein [Serratia marcescens]POX09438.1 KTSC domain-containing protein [Serratia marcescens]
MERTYVDSSNLESVGYDSNNYILEVEFKRGAVYQYINVPEYVFEELMSAGSIGSYFNLNIRNVYPTERV